MSHQTSKIFDLIAELKSWNTEVVVHDPWADRQDVISQYGVDLSDMVNLKELDAIVVAVGHSEFRCMNPEELIKFCKPRKKTVFGDLKAIYNRDELIKSGFDVFRL